MSRWSHGSLATCRIILTIIRNDCRFFIGQTWTLFFFVAVHYHIRVARGAAQCLWQARSNWNFVSLWQNCFLIVRARHISLEMPKLFLPTRATHSPGDSRQSRISFSQLIWQTTEIDFNDISQTCTFFSSLEAGSEQKIHFELNFSHSPKIEIVFKSKISITRTILESYSLKPETWRWCWCW